MPHFWWPDLYPDVESYIRHCQDCAYARPNLAAEIDHWPHADPWERLHIYGLGPRTTRDIHMHIVVDAGSGWIEACLCANRTAETVKEHLTEIFSHQGIPHTIISDNAPEFVTLSDNGSLDLDWPIRVNSDKKYPKENQNQSKYQYQFQY
eukprot:Pompholyxophrys_punicea_v1_NODE_703_length_1427_cov_13.845481.p1 type:complete len:150 gc:universal NODE_703_length_1427_cov_13.845481:723-1172(+)